MDSRILIEARVEFAKRFPAESRRAAGGGNGIKVMAHTWLDGFLAGTLHGAKRMGGGLEDCYDVMRREVLSAGEASYKGIRELSGGPDESG